MKSLAEARGFTATQLLTPKATRARVQSEIERAATTLQSGDIFFLTYSGHGGQVPDMNDDEPDHTDETWCLFDGQLIDDELYALWPKFRPGVRILVLSDSCHSGSAVRTFLALAESPAARALVAPATQGEQPRPRAMPEEVALRTFRANRQFYGQLQRGPSAESIIPELQVRVRLISGCQDSQVSLDGTFNGLFTGTLLKVWKEGAFQGNYSDFAKAIVARMPQTQVPNHFVIGAPNPTFDAQSPFTI
jgi:hypothetical protein